MDSGSNLLVSAPARGAQSFRGGAARRLNGLSKMLHYAAVFTIISLTMVVMGFSSILASLWGEKE